MSEEQGSTRGALKIVSLIALRNLASHKVKSGIVGSIMLFGTMLVVVFGALLDSVESSMQRVVTSSLAGHLQVYSAKGRDALSLFGGLTASLPDVGEIEDFKAVKSQLESIDNVKTVVPMGIGVATGTTGNDLDLLIGKLRVALRDGDAEQKTQTITQLRQIADLLRREYSSRERVSADEAQLKREREVLDRVTSDAFWQALERDPEPNLLYLDTRFAPLSSDGRMFFVRYLGTDPELFTKSFDRFKVARGQAIPKGQRGVLLSKRVHERFLKHRVARQLDRIKQEKELEGRSIDTDELLQGRVRRLSRQHRPILYQIDPKERPILISALKEALPEDQREGDLPTLISRFLTVNDANFYARYDHFYKKIAPMLELYRVKIGDVVTLQSFTRQGYVRAVNVRVWGTFQFEGIEDSDLAGTVNLMDMITFRELYGKMSEAQLKELSKIREDAGVKDVKRADAEDALFGGDGPLVEDGADPNAQKPVDEFQGVTIISRQDRLKALAADTYTTEQLHDGVALNAAIILKDPARIDETRAAIERLSAERRLELKVVDWQEAAGIVGQVIIVIRVVLTIAIVIIFLVAAVIINNSMIMATMERVSEIGTMRAIGARRRFVLGMILIETSALGAISGGAGALLGVGIITVLGRVGIPAPNEIMRFLFAGPRLHPTVTAENILFALIAVFLVSLASTLYPAIIATRIQPVVAMRGRE